MTKLPLAIVVLLLTSVTPALGQAPVPQTNSKPKATKATYLMTGLHCPPCTRTVEASLAGVKGILGIKVDWKTKAARIEFDETVLPAQKVSQMIAATRHMMGGAFHYGGWLALKVPGIKDEASGKRAEEALATIEGVKTAKAYPEQHTVAVNFAPKGEVTTRQLIASLSDAGFQAESY